ncbi:transmembrane and immunoglobulin domain-containing protein 1-like [Sardina pilchardus]|uniref:transmembrane and immunoglobulin domain-containing protein 1-like n=1 Tax=Sardina pilchardus TaxID=27697 RepID=UPI002E104185
MGVMWTSALAHLVLLIFRAEALEVASNPPVDGGGFIQTRLDQIVGLECRTAAADGKAELQWFRNGMPVALQEGNYISESHLCIQPVTREDNGAIFRCQVKNNAALNGSLQLEVTYAPELSGKEELSVEEESSLTLSCDSRANPPVTMVWSRDGQALDLSEGRFTATNDGVTARLSVRSVERELHQGEYTCTATSPVEPQKTKSFQITVTDKTIKFPRDPMIAGIVVVVCTAILALLARWERIAKCCK